MQILLFGISKCFPGYYLPVTSKMFLGISETVMPSLKSNCQRTVIVCHWQKKISALLISDQAVLNGPCGSAKNSKWLSLGCPRDKSTYP